MLLHEMVYVRNHCLGLADCDDRSQYHNRYFRDMAVLVGLACDERHPRFGYAFAGLNDQGHEGIAKLVPDADVFRWSVQA
jgi:hypothetical protein